MNMTDNDNKSNAASKLLFDIFFYAAVIMIIVRFGLKRSGVNEEAMEAIIFGLVLSAFIIKVGMRLLPKWFHNNKPSRLEIEERIHGVK